jgi:hypothetical protein
MLFWEFRHQMAAGRATPTENHFRISLTMLLIPVQP